MVFLFLSDYYAEDRTNLFLRRSHVGLRINQILLLGFLDLRLILSTVISGGYFRTS